MAKQNTVSTCKAGNKGADSAHTAIEMANLLRNIRLSGGAKGELRDA